MFTLATKFTPEKTAFQVASDAGFRAAEFYLDPQILTQPELIASTAEQFPFRYAMHFPNHGPISDDLLRDLVSIYRRLHCTALVIHQPMFDRYSEPLLEIDPDLDLAIENHIFDWTGFERWADESPGLTLDVEHLWKFTLNDAPLEMVLTRLDQFLDRHSKKLQHVHLLGYQPGGEEHRPIHHNPDLAMAVLTRFAKYGYSKLVVCEADLPHQTQESLAQDVALFDQWQKSRQQPSQK